MKGSMRYLVATLLLCGVASSIGKVGTIDVSSQRADVSLVQTLPILHEWCHLLAFLPEGSLLAANWLEAITWRTEDWSVARLMDRALLVGRVVGVSPDGARLLVARTDGEIALFDSGTIAPAASLGRLLGSDRPRVAFGAGGRLLAVKNREREVDVWDLATHTQLYTVQGHGSEILSVTFSPDGLWLATGAGRLDGTISDSLIKVWNAATGALVATVATLAIGNNLDIVFTPDGASMITVGTYGVIIYETSTWTQVQRLSGHRTWSHGGAISPDGQVLATVNDFAELCLWSVQTWELLLVRDLGGTATRVAFCADGSLLACATGDGGRILVFALP